MALPICLELPEIPDALPITLPSGVTFERINLLEEIQPLLAPLVPLFDIVDTIVAVFNCVKAIPDALGPPPDPTVLAACVPELGEKIAKLLRLLPQLSLPLLIRQVLDLIIDTLQRARREIVYLQSQMQRILEAIDRASDLDDAGLMAIIQCARGNVEQEARNVGKMLASLGRLIGLVNLFLGILGLPQVPDLSDLAGQPLDEVIEPLDQLIATFEAAKLAVPLP
ncbi:MAG TPA: hypothetical protein VM686_05105 [Polyangiaceae bacterium]|nr:hypothetical protein [Polyangiaceae bacterium]